MYNEIRVMKMKYSCFVMILVLFSVLTSEGVFAQRSRSILRVTKAHGYPTPYAVGVHVGSTGFGAHLYKSLGKEFGARLGFSHMPFGTSIVGEYADRDVTTKLRAKSTNISLLFGWTPFVQTNGFFRSFGFSLGAAYFTQLHGKMTSRLSDPYELGDITVDPEMVGDIKTHVQWKETVSPYVGAGWNNAIIGKQFSLNVDLGMYYLSKPTISMEASGLLESNTSNFSTVQKNIENYRYLPRVEVGVSYYFGRR